MKLLPCIVILLFSAQAALPCANMAGSGTSYEGEKVSGGYKRGVVGLRRALRRDRHPDGAAIEMALRDSTRFEDRSDYAVALMYLGRSEEAVKRLRQLEQEKPGEYFVAANLGTAYELSGNNEEALRWIKEGIRRNPESHQGTEWLHVKILEAKIAGQRDPDYFKKHSVLDLKPGSLRRDATVGDTELPPDGVASAIQYQLEERLQFVKPPDPAVASLLFDYAAIEAATRTLETAKDVLRLAVEYGYPTEQVQPLVALYDHRIAWRKTKEYCFYALIGLAIVGLLWRLYRKGILVISRAS
jgi:tetratricopeptide (TPR) repeat protein